MTTPELLDSTPVHLRDGRTVRVQSYSDGSIRIRIRDDQPYAIVEAFLTKGKNQDRILKLIPVRDEEREAARERIWNSSV